jgi:hypothetical protein
MSTALYLKKNKDVLVYGDTYDAYCLSIDITFIDVDFGNVTRDYTQRKKIGNGAIIDGGFFYSPRIITLTKKYVKDSTTNVFSPTRLTLLNTWLTTNDAIWLYRIYGTDVQRIRVYPRITGSEKYNNYKVSDNIKIEFLCESPFFESRTLTTITATKTAYIQDITATLSGVSTPFIFTYTPQYQIYYVELKQYESMGFKVSITLDVGEVMTIDSSNMEISVDGAYRIATVEGSPFLLLSGLNTLQLISNDLGTYTLSYYQRHI